MKRVFSLMGYGALVVCLLCVPGFAQTAGEITGAVKDSSGAVISGATVTATNQASGAVRTTVSNEAGVYSFPVLLPGTYTCGLKCQAFVPLYKATWNCRCNRSRGSILPCRWGKLLRQLR